MGKEEPLVMEGVITEHLPNTRFRVKLDNEHQILAHLAGKLRRYHIRLLPGDRVKVELSPYDLTQGRIVYRLTGSQRAMGRDPAAPGAKGAEPGAAPAAPTGPTPATIRTKPVYKPKPTHRR